MPLQSSVIPLVASAAFVGLMHSLAPGHWLPSVLMAKTRRWPLPTAILGALTAAGGHFVVSGLVAGLSLFLRSRLPPETFTDDALLERYAAFGLGVFGLVYAANAYWGHARCDAHAHSHHPEEPPPGADKNPRAPRQAAARAPFFFLFASGFSPCVAVLPVLGAAAIQGPAAALLTMLAFTGGVALTFVVATVLVTRRLARLDHPFLEHYSDVVTGAGVACVGFVTFAIL